MRAIDPRDSTEALLVVQTGPIHNATMVAARRLTHSIDLITRLTTGALSRGSNQDVIGKELRPQILAVSHVSIQPPRVDSD